MVSPVPQLPTAAGLAWNSVDAGEGGALVTQVLTAH